MAVCIAADRILVLLDGNGLLLVYQATQLAIISVNDQTADGLFTSITDRRPTMPTPATLTTAVALFAILFLVAGTLLSLSSSPHWFVRGWDFPRVQIIVVGWLLVAATYLVQATLAAPSAVPAWPVLVAAVYLTGWHGFSIYPYTFLAEKQSKPSSNSRSPDSNVHAHRIDPSSIRVVISNVKMENDQYQKWMTTMRAADPDILIAVEIDQAWTDALQPLIETFEHRVIVPHDNYYGIMMLSKLPMEEHEVRYVVQKDIPSIDARIRLDDGGLIRVVGVHPRPPEPIRNIDAVARDAELTLWGVEIEKESGPTIIGGDLNDVAWSQTTRLFLRTSDLLDPRRGRGFFNTFHADHLYMRFPLDHIFHSDHFTINRIERLEHVGSDHFPMMIDLKHDPSNRQKHQVLRDKASDRKEVEERIDRAAESDECQGQAVDGDQSNGEREIDHTVPHAKKVD